MSVKHAVMRLCFGRRSAAVRQRQDLDHQNLRWQRQGDHIARIYGGSGLADAAAVEPEVPLFDPSLGKIAACRKAQVPDEFVGPHYRSNSLSAANALPGTKVAGLSGVEGSLRPDGSQRQRGNCAGPNAPGASGRGMICLNPPSRSNRA